MKKILKNFLITALTLTLILSGTTSVFASDSAGIKVQYNGNNITFTDAAAKIVDGRTMVPFRQTLEAMGANVSFDPSTKTILAKVGEREISFAVGEKDITIIENGVKTIKNMDVAPFIDTKLNRTYIPVRFIAESIGYYVGWDSYEKTVVIINPATLFSNADSDFSIITKLLKTDLDFEKAYDTTSQFNVNVTTSKTPESIFSGMDFTLTGKVSGIQQKANADMLMSMALNADKMASTMSTEQKSQLQPFMDQLKNVTMKIKMNGETGVTYMNSDIFKVMDPTVNSNTWYKMNVYDIYDDMGIDLRSMVNMNYSGIKLSKILEESFAATDYVTEDTYQDMKTTYTFLKALIGDKAFKMSTSGGVNTYTLDLNKASVVSAAMDTMATEGITMSSLELSDIGEITNLDGFAANIIIKDKDGVLNGYSLNGKLLTDDINISFNMSGDQKNADADMTFDDKDVMKMIINMESHVTETTKAPDINPPADAKILEYPY